MIRGVVITGLVGLGLIGGAGAVAYDDDGTATVKIKDRKPGTEQTVRLRGPGGKMYSCPPGTSDKLSPHDTRAGRITLTLRQVHREERKIDNQYPGRTAPAAVAARFNGLIRRHKRLIAAYNESVDRRNAILEADCV